MDIHDTHKITGRLRDQSNAGHLRITSHAHQEMVEEHIRLDDVFNVLRNATVIENYPNHKRGACCLVAGRSSGGRDLHVVCTTALDTAIIITVYEPKLPKWLTPFERRDIDEM